MARTATATSALGRSRCPGVVLLGVLLGGILEHILADRRLPLGLLLKVGGHLGQLSLLFRVELIAAFPEELTFQFG
jgi:hypothetical protein